MKKFFLLSIACLTLSATAQVDASKVSKVYDSRIEKREVKVASFEVQKHETNLITAESLKAKKEVEDSRFVGLLKAAKHAATFKANGEKQTLDSLVRYQGKGETGLYGSKQEFHYNEDGQPVQCVNYIPDEETGQGWKYVGEYVYEYDDFGRLIAATSTSDYGYYSYGERYEYIYDEDGKPYTMLIYYYQEGDSDWMPMQYAAYGYDDQNRTINEEFYYTEDGGESWIGQSKKTTSYNEQGLMTSYFEYEWSYETNDWVGSSYVDGQQFYYRADGKDDWIANFIWENGQWTEYIREFLTYDENGMLILDEYKAWNRADQDWTGGDSWGPWATVENNKRIEYTYDENGHCTLELSTVCYHDGSTWNNFKRTRDYTALENGRWNNEEKVYLPLTSSELSLYNHRTIITNRFGSEVYYMNRNYVGANIVLRKTEEIIREIDDETNRYYVGIFYSFTNNEANTRYGSAYETVGYDAMGNIINTHQKIGTGYDTDDTWAEYLNGDYSYEADANGKWVMVSYDGTSYQDGEWIPESGYSNIYDFDTPREDVVIWPISNKGNNFYTYKTLQEYNYAYYSWSNTMNEYTDVFYYSDGGHNTGIEEVKATPQLTGEVQYFDVQGHRVNADAHGIIIVRDANGNAYKIIK